MKRPLKNELICEKARCLGLAWELLSPVDRYRYKPLIISIG